MVAPATDRISELLSPTGSAPGAPLTAVRAVVPDDGRLRRLAHEDTLHDAGLRDGDEVRVVTGELGPESTEPVSFEELLSLPNVHLIVDGSMPEVRNTAHDIDLSFEAWSERLLLSLSTLAAETRAETTCIFDGATASGLARLPKVPARVRVLFTERGTSVPELIGRLARAEPVERDVVVVTSTWEPTGPPRFHWRVQPLRLLRRILDPATYDRIVDAMAAAPPPDPPEAGDRREATRAADAVDEPPRGSTAQQVGEHRDGAYTVSGDAEARLVERLGGELHRRPVVLQLLLDLEEGAARGGESGTRAVVQAAFRLYEYLFVELAVEYPFPTRPSWATGSLPPTTQLMQQALISAAEDIGLEGPPVTYLQRHILDGLRTGKVREGLEHRVTLGDLVPYVLVAAADPQSPHRSGHPMRALARDRPSVLSDLDTLRSLRNQVSHSHQVGESTDRVEVDIAWCRELAMDAARLLLSMPPPPSAAR